MSKKKIFYVLSVFLLLGVTMSSLNVRAHAPINIDLYYDVGDQELSIRLTHGVTDPEYHRIEEIDVWINHTQVWEDHTTHEHYYWDRDNYAVAILPTGPPTYSFNNTNHPDFDEQPTDVTPITRSHTLPIYYLPFPAELTGEVVPVEDPTSGLFYDFRGEGRTNITVDVKCSLGGSLTEHYYVGLPYYNPHLTFAEAAAPATVSTIIVIALLFALPKLGQKGLPKLPEGNKKQ